MNAVDEHRSQNIVTSIIERVMPYSKRLLLIAGIVLMAETLAYITLSGYNRSIVFKGSLVDGTFRT